MKRIQPILLGFLFIGGSISQTVLSNTMVKIETSSGENIEIGIDANDRFLDVLNEIHSYFQNEALAKEEQNEALTFGAENSSRHPQWNLVVSHAGLAARAKKEDWRNYHVSVSKEEKQEIRYIITTLATYSLFGVGKERSSLNKAGDRIDHLHPFRFLMTIFTDEELKAGAASIRDRGGLVGGGFFDGITGSLKKEASQNNLLQFTADFAKKVKIDEDLISPSLEKGKWKEFVNILIDKIPREIDPNRYNM